MLKGTRSICLDVCNYDNQAICNLYDSTSDLSGQATDVFVNTERNGWKELTFSLPATYMGDEGEETNYRLRYLIADYRIRLRTDKETDWYLISEPRVTHNIKKKKYDVTAGHISQLLKTKNLDLEFSDEEGNNVGTAEELLTTILEGTGWSVGYVAPFLEDDGETIKVRSITASAKTGAFSLISNVCDKFEAKPIYKGEGRIVDLVPMNPFSEVEGAEIPKEVLEGENVLELRYGNNVTGLSRTLNTENLVTRLYAYGAYGEVATGYCGIDTATHNEYTFTMSAYPAGTEFKFLDKDNIAHYFVADAISNGNVLIWSDLDMVSRSYVWNNNKKVMYKTHSEPENDTWVTITGEQSTHENKFKYIMDFNYYAQIGLLTDRMRSELAKFQRKMPAYLDMSVEATSEFLNEKGHLSKIAESNTGFLRLDIQNYTTDSDGRLVLHIRKDFYPEGVMYRSDYDEARRNYFSWYCAEKLKDNGDPVYGIGSVVYIIHQTDPITWEKSYVKLIDGKMETMDYSVHGAKDPDSITLWVASNKVPLLSQNDRFYLFSTNSMTGELGTLETQMESMLQSLQQATKVVTEEHPTYFVWNNDAEPSVQDITNSYGWYYRTYTDSRDGLLYFCYGKSGDTTWRRVYLADSTPPIVNNTYYFNLKTKNLYHGENSKWVNLADSSILVPTALNPSGAYYTAPSKESKRLSQSFSKVAYYCMRYDRLYKGLYDKYIYSTGNSTLPVGNYAFYNGYGAYWAFSTTMQIGKNKQIWLDTTADGAYHVYQTQDIADIVQSEAKAYDAVDFPVENELSGSKVLSGAINVENGAEENSNTKHRSSHIKVYSDVVYEYKLPSGTYVTFFDQDRTYISYQSLSTSGTFKTAARAEYIRLVFSSTPTASHYVRVQNYSQKFFANDVEYTMLSPLTTENNKRIEEDATIKRYLQRDRDNDVKPYIPTGYDGNADLAARVVIPAAKFIDAGWEFPGTYGTIFSRSYTAGKTEEWGLEYDKNIVVSLTPVTAYGEVLTPTELDDYFDHLISRSTASGRTLFSGDEMNLLLRVYEAAESESVTSAVSKEDAWDIALHNMQEQWDIVRATNGFYGETSLDPAGIFYDLSSQWVNPYLVELDGDRNGMLRYIREFADTADNCYLYYLKKYQDAQKVITDNDNTLKEVLGDMYREGFWQKNEYVEDDEDKLYKDALKNLEKIAKPESTYDVQFLDLYKSNQGMGFSVDEDLDDVEWPDIEITDAIHLIDETLDINCWAFVDKLNKCYDQPWKTSLEINTNLSLIAQHSFTDVMARIAEVANETAAKQTIYQRASSISGTGKFTAEKLEGTIKTNVSKLTGGSSGWYTDSKGNMIFESTDGQSAMMLTGYGWAVSSGKDSDGDWVWRYTTTASGMTADFLAAGEISTKLLTAGVITADQLHASVGQELEIGSNAALMLYATTDGYRPSGSLKTLIDNGDGTFSPVKDGDSYIQIVAQKGNEKAKINIMTGGFLNLYGGSNVNIESGSAMNIKANGKLKIESGSSFVVNSPNFTINENGDVSMTGTINSSAGNIAGFTIGGVKSGNTWIRQYITSNGKTSYDTSGNGTYIGTDGVNMGNGALRIKSDGSDTYFKVKASQLTFEAEEGVTQSSYKDQYMTTDVEYVRVYKLGASNKTAPSLTQTNYSNDTTWKEYTLAINLDYPYLWTRIRRKHRNGEYHYDTATIDAGLQAVETTAKRIAEGTDAVPYVETTGFYVKQNLVQLKSTGEMQILGNSKVYIGSSSSNSAVVLDKNGIAIGSAGKIDIVSGGTVTIGNAGSVFTIGSNKSNAYIYNGMTKLDSTDQGIYLGTDGIGLGGGAFKVTKAGALTSTSGSIGGWNIGSDHFGNNATRGNATIGLGTGTGDTIVFWAGGKPTDSNTPFTLTASGKMKFNSGSINLGGNFIANTDGTVTIKKGSINLGDKFIADTNGNVTIKKGSIDLGSGAFNVTDQGVVTMTKGSITIKKGDTVKFKVTDEGALTSVSGSIGGWTINDNSLVSNNGSISAGDNFSVSSTGKLKATGAEISGDISITSGSITLKDGNTTNFNVTKTGELTAIKGTVGGWYIGSDYIGNANSLNGSTVGVANKSGDNKVFWAGMAYNAAQTNLKFYVTSAGYLYAVSGSIGGWKIAQNSLTSDGGSISAGSNFSVTSTGVLTVKNADISGKITTSSGSIGPWTISSSGIKSTYTMGSLYWTAGFIGAPVDTSGDIFYLTLNNSYFRINPFCNLYASENAQIAGWNITKGTNALIGYYVNYTSYQTDATYDSFTGMSAEQDYSFWTGWKRIWDGSRFVFSQQPFYVKKDGTLKSKHLSFVSPNGGTQTDIATADGLAAIHVTTGNNKMEIAFDMNNKNISVAYSTDNGSSWNRQVLKQW